MFSPILDALDCAPPPPKQPYALDDLLADYILERDIKPVSAEQLRITIDAVKLWAATPAGPPKTAARVDPRAIVAELDENTLCIFLRSQRDVKHLAAKTVNGRRGNLLTLLRFAFGRGRFPHAPDARRVIRFREPTRNPTAWTQQQLRGRILPACAAYAPAREIPGWDGRHWVAIALVMYYSAYRFSACLALERTNLRDDGAICAEAESQKTLVEDVRWLGADAMEAIAKLPIADERLFPWPFAKAAFWRHWKQILLATGLPATRRDGPQRMRRTSATWMEHFVPGSAKAHLGHKTPGMAERHYIDRTIATSAKASEILPRLVG